MLRDLLIANGFTSKMGNADFAGFSRKLTRTHYETLRKAVSGNRQPSSVLMEDCAQTLGVSPTVFIEYHLWQARRCLNPDEVGLDQALAALKGQRCANTEALTP